MFWISYLNNKVFFFLNFNKIRVIYEENNIIGDIYLYETVRIFSPEKHKLLYE